MNLDPHEEWIAVQSEYLCHVDEGQAGYIKSNCLLPLLMAHLRVPPGEKVLDIGCGNGWLRALIPDAEYYGLDVALPTELMQEGNFKRGSIQEASLDRESFDLCVASMLFQFIPDLEGALAKIFGTLKPGGRLFVLIPEPYFYNTGEVDDKGHFVLRTPLSRSATFKVSIGHELPKVSYFYRSTSEYVNLAIRVGYAVKGIHESYLDVQDFHSKFERAEIAKRRTDKAPMFQLIRLERPLR